jgi:serine/threonine protein kinase
MRGGNLFDFICENELSDVEGLLLSYQVVKSVLFLHQNGFFHGYSLSSNFKGREKRSNCSLPIQRLLDHQIG